MKVDLLDCCQTPDIEIVKVVLNTNRETESLCQCVGCGQYWFHRFLEIMKFEGPDDQTTWYSRITVNEAEAIIANEERPDLTFLLTKPSIMKNNNVIQSVSGQPDKPLYG